MIRALLLVTLLSGCTIPVKLPEAGGCRAEGTIGYIGQRYTPRIGRILKDKSQATYVRPLAPDTVVTQEFRGNRLNIALDERNTITRIYCG